MSRPTEGFSATMSCMGGREVTGFYPALIGHPLELLPANRDHSTGPLGRVSISSSTSISRRPGLKGLRRT
jgi:hypothetical protein